MANLFAKLKNKSGVNLQAHGGSTAIRRPDARTFESESNEEQPLTEQDTVTEVDEPMSDSELEQTLQQSIQQEVAKEIDAKAEAELESAADADIDSEEKAESSADAESEQEQIVTKIETKPAQNIFLKKTPLESNIARYKKMMAAKMN